MKPNTKINTSIRQDTLYLVKHILKESVSELVTIDYSRDIEEILQDYTLMLVKSCNNMLDKIEGRGYR